MKLIIQPGDGAASIIRGITRAKSSVEIAIFRFDQREIEQALARAVSRGVSVHASIAHTNRAGEANLRELEMRLLAAGATVTRTADDLVRYHGKMMIVDRRDLYLMAFNLTHQDMERSRSFAVITSSRSLVREAAKLFEADSKRNPYEAGLGTFVVSPINARNQLAAFIQGARKQLLIYDPKVSDAAMIQLLRERTKAGVEVRIIGTLTRQNTGLEVRKLNQRLHTRTMIRDGRFAFMGSQSLREMELDMRREIGIIFRDARTVNRLEKTFESDWQAAGQAREDRGEATQPAQKVAKKIAKVVVKELPDVAPVMDTLVKELVGDTVHAELDTKEVQETVKDAVKEAVKAAVQDAVEEVMEHSAGKAV